MKVSKIIAGNPNGLYSVIATLVRHDSLDDDEEIEEEDNEEEED